MSTCAVVRRKYKGTTPSSSQGMTGIGLYYFNGILKGKKPPHFSPSHAWSEGILSSKGSPQKTDPYTVFDIQSRLMGLNTQTEPNLSFLSIPWEEWTTEQPGCYGHHRSGLTVSQPFTSVQMQHLQPQLLWGTLKHEVPPTPHPSNDTLLRVW